MRIPIQKSKNTTQTLLKWAPIPLREYTPRMQTGIAARILPGYRNRAKVEELASTESDFEYK